MNEDWRGWDYNQECHCERCILVDNFITKLKLEHLAPRKGNNMNDFNTETPVGEAIVDVRHFIIDPTTGERIEVPFDASNGEAASEETTVYVAEDLADHSVTIH